MLFELFLGHAVCPKSFIHFYLITILLLLLYIIIKALMLPDQTLNPSRARAGQRVSVWLDYLVIWAVGLTSPPFFLAQTVTR
jgi:hypothetical protein